MVLESNVVDSEQLGMTGGRVVARLVRHLEAALDPLDLSLPQYRLLGFLAEGETPSSKLATSMAVSPPSVTAVVDGLVARGLVERRSDATDRRRFPLVLTDAGRDVLARANGAVGQRLGEILGYLDDRRAAAARTSLGHWQAGLDRHREAKRQAQAASAQSSPTSASAATTASTTAS
jgi:long-chain acyl-CoA synthetase